MSREYRARKAILIRNPTGMGDIIPTGIILIGTIPRCLSGLGSIILIRFMAAACSREADTMVTTAVAVMAEVEAGSAITDLMRVT